MASLTDLLSKSRVDFKRHGEHHHVGKGWVGIDCPKCSPGWGTYRLGFETSTGRTHCWFCGALDGVAIIAELCGISLRESADALRKTDYQVDGHTERVAGKLQLPPAGPLLEAHISYLRGRRFDPNEIIRLWNIKGIGMASRLAWRILIPICDKHGRTVSWTTRAVGRSVELRYISATPEEESFPHKELLYGAHHARNSIAVVEGPISAWGVGPGGVATCGIGWTEAQLIEMTKYPVRIVCLDSTPDAQRRAAQLCRELSAFPGVTENVCLESGKDPAEADRQEVDELRKLLFL